jgi:DNA-binding CsgD family transcriptional regulator
MSKMPPSQEGPDSAVSRGDDVRCPNCGVRESEGGCKDPLSCREAIAGKAEEAFAELNAIDQSSTRPFRLLVAGFEALDLLNIGLAVASSSGLLLMANRSFEQILGTNDGLELSPAGVLHEGKGSTFVLSEMLQGVTRGSAGRPSGPAAVIALPRAGGKRPLTLHVRPVNRVQAGGPGSPQPAVLIFVLDPNLAVEAAEAELHQLYELTSTEARMANLLMEGKTLEECCRELDIRRSTARTHLQHLFEKVGVQRQSELVSVLWKSIGLVRTNRGSRERKTQSPMGTERLNDTLVRLLMNRATRALEDL